MVQASPAFQTLAGSTMNTSFRFTFLKWTFTVLTVIAPVGRVPEGIWCPLGLTEPKLTKEEAKNLNCPISDQCWQLTPDELAALLATAPSAPTLPPELLRCKSSKWRDAVLSIKLLTSSLLSSLLKHSSADHANLLVRALRLPDHVTAPAAAAAPVQHVVPVTGGAGSSAHAVENRVLALGIQGALQATSLSSFAWTVYPSSTGVCVAAHSWISGLRSRGQLVWLQIDRVAGDVPTAELSLQCDSWSTALPLQRRLLRNLKIDNPLTLRLSAAGVKAAAASGGVTDVAANSINTVVWMPNSATSDTDLAALVADNRCEVVALRVPLHILTPVVVSLVVALDRAAFKVCECATISSKLMTAVPDSAVEVRMHAVGTGSVADVCVRPAHCSGLLLSTNAARCDVCRDTHEQFRSYSRSRAEPQPSETTVSVQTAVGSTVHVGDRVLNRKIRLDNLTPVRSSLQSCCCCRCW